MGSAMESDFAAIERALRAGGALGEPAEIHGEFCGLTCVMGADAGPAWVASTLADAGAHGGDIGESLQSLAAETYRALDAGNMELFLLLPADSEPLETRAESLGFWCQGFMHGLGAGREPGATDALLAEGIAHEIIADFSQITRVAFAADETESEGEAAYMELVEYVRVSVQLVYEDLRRVREASNDGRRH